MKTQEYLKELKDKNIRIPGDWAVIQSASGHFIGFLPPELERVDIKSTHKTFHEIVMERERIEKEAVKESKLSQL